MFLTKQNANSHHRAKALITYDEDLMYAPVVFRTRQDNSKRDLDVRINELFDCVLVLISSEYAYSVFAQPNHRILSKMKR